MNKRHFHAFCRAAALLCFGVGLPALSLALPDMPEAAPLIQEGKKTLFQRVVSHPGATLYAKPDQKGKSLRSLTPFTVLYVYGQSKGWLQVGTGTQQPEGWIEAGRSTPWNQSLTLLFSPRTGRDPVLFFKEEKGLNDVCQAVDMEQRLDKLLAAAQSTPAADLPIVASEPAETRGAVSAKRFYLMPILEMKDPYEGVKFLQVASIDPGNAGERQPAAAGAGAPRTGIAIVMDTSVSMKPYIDQSRNVVRTIYDQLERDGMTDNVGFAVVAFRSSTKATPALDYTTRVVSDFATAKNRAALEQRLAEAQEATVSSHDFNEDSLAGVYKAVESLSWGDYSSRLILLVTDAGPLRPGDKYPIKIGTSKHAEKYDPSTSQISLKLPWNRCAIKMANIPTAKMAMRLERTTFLKRFRKRSKLSVLEAINRKELSVDKMMDKIPATKNPRSPTGSSWMA